MITPYLTTTGIMGALGGPMGFAKMYGANLLGQQLADPDAEFDDLNQFASFTIRYTRWITQILVQHKI